MILETANWRVNAGSISADGLSLVDLSGKGRHAVFGTAAQKPTVLPYSGVPYWYEPDPNAGASTLVTLAGGGAPAVNTSVQAVINGTLKHRTTSSAQLVQYGDNPNGWIIYSGSAGDINSWACVAGAINIVQLKVSGGFSTKAWHRFTYIKGTGAVQYEDSDDGVTWNTVGSGTHTVNPNPLISGYCALGAGSLAHSVPGNRYYASFVVDGVKIAEFNPKDVNFNYTQVVNTGTVGSIWAVTRDTTTTVPRGVIVDRPIVLFGGGQKADVAGYRPNGDSVPLTVLVAVRDFADTATENYNLSATTVVVNTAPGWLLYKPGGFNYVSVRAKDGSTGAQASATAAPPRVGVLCGVVSKTSVTPYWAGVKGSPTAVALTTTAPDADLTLGRVAATYGNFEFIAAAVFERQLSDVEIAMVSNEILDRNYQQYPSVSDFERANLLSSAPGALPSDTIADLRRKLYASTVPSTYNSNLLTANQASMEIDASGWSPWYSATVSKSSTVSKHGTSSLAMTASAAGGSGIYLDMISSGNTREGMAFTAQVSVCAATVNRAIRLRLQFYNSIGTALMPFSDANGTSTVGIWTVLNTTGIAPAGAARARINIEWLDAALPSGEIHYIDSAGFWEGSDATWAMPGQGGLITVSDLEQQYIENYITDELPSDTIYDLRRKSYMKTTGSSGQTLTTDDLKFMKEVNSK